MPLFEPTIPAEPIPKPKKRRKGHGLRITPRFVTNVAGVLMVAIGYTLIRLDQARTAAGNPPNGEWDLIGAMMIGFVILCVVMSFKRPKKPCKGCGL